jgi:hypothetical protein
MRTLAMRDQLMLLKKEINFARKSRTNSDEKCHDFHRKIKRGEVAMMGRQGGDQAPLFYSFNLDQHIPPDHLIRNIDRFLDQSEIHQHLAPFYSDVPTLDQSGVDDTHAHGRLLLWYSIRAAPMRSSAIEFSVTLLSQILNRRQRLKDVFSISSVRFNRADFR